MVLFANYPTVTSSFILIIFQIQYKRQKGEQNTKNSSSRPWWQDLIKNIINGHTAMPIHIVCFPLNNKLTYTFNGFLIVIFCTQYTAQFRTLSGNEKCQTNCTFHYCLQSKRVNKGDIDFRLRKWEFCESKLLFWTLSSDTVKIVEKKPNDPCMTV